MTGWMAVGWLRGSGGGGGGAARRERGKLVGYLLQKEDSCGAGIGGQLLIALNDERCNGSSKQTSLG